MTQNKLGFSLFELVLVVLLLGVVYAVVLGTGFSSTTPKVSKGSLPTFWLSSKDIKLVLYDRCSKVARYQRDGNYTKEKLEATLEDIEVYTTNTFEHFTYSDKIIGDEFVDICLILERNENSTLKPLILHLDNLFYLISPFPEEIKSFSSLEKLKTFSKTEELMPQDEQRYYYE